MKEKVPVPVRVRIKQREIEVQRDVRDLPSEWRPVDMPRRWKV